MVISADDFLKGRVLTQDDVISEGTTPKRATKNPTDHKPSSAITDVHNLQELAESEDIAGTFRRDEEETRCQESALRLLDAAARPSGALRTRLLGKEFDEDTVDVVVERLTRLGLLDDESYARSAVRYCASRRMGEMGTFAELKRKGVDERTARDAVNQAKDAGVFVESAYALVEYVAKRTQGLDKQVRLRRLWSAAGRKGHSADLIREAQYDVFNAEEDAEDDAE